MSTVNTVPGRGGLAAQHRIAAIVAAAVLAGLPIYVLAVELFFSGARGRTYLLRPEKAVLMRYILYGTAAAAVVLMRALRGMILRKRPGEDEASAGRKLLLASILTTALSEVPALLGLFLCLAAGLKTDFYILTGVSAVLMFMFFPRLANWREWAAG
jgi:hypothetical protein